MYTYIYRYIYIIDIHVHVYLYKIHHEYLKTFKFIYAKLCLEIIINTKKILSNFYLYINGICTLTKLEDSFAVIIISSVHVIIIILFEKSFFRVL